MRKLRALRKGFWFANYRGPRLTRKRYTFPHYLFMKFSKTGSAMCILNILRELNNSYGNLIQAAFVGAGFIFAILQLSNIKRSARSNAMHQIATSNRELMSLRLQYYSQRDTEEALRIFPSLITNHCAYLYVQRELKVITDNWWSAILYDMQQTYQDDSLRSWWKRDSVQKCYSIPFRNFMKREIINKV